MSACLYFPACLFPIHLYFSCFLLYFSVVLLVLSSCSWSLRTSLSVCLSVYLRMFCMPLSLSVSLSVSVSATSLSIALFPPTPRRILLNYGLTCRVGQTRRPILGQS